MVQLHKESQIEQRWILWYTVWLTQEQEKGIKKLPKEGCPPTNEIHHVGKVK